MSLNFSMKSSTTSAPTSPAKNVSSFLSRATSLTSSVTSNVTGMASRISSQIKESGKHKVLLVIDDLHTDWSKYFRGKRLLGEFDIRVEQCEFRHLSLVTNSEMGPLCLVTSERMSTRSFRPDFLLVRQHVKDSRFDFISTLLGLKYGGLPSINSIHSLYNLVDRPWVYSQLIGIQRRLGRENFPLIEQTYYPSHCEMINCPPRFPCVVKIGYAHGGLGKIRVSDPTEYEDIVSLVACTKTYATVEPYIDSKCDIHIQKIGTNYKAFMRKSISGNWKANVGSSLIEQCPVTERYKRWIDEVSELFNGLDVVALEAVLSKDGKEYIYEVTGSQMTLMGETQEEDRRLIADLVCSKMQHFCGRPIMTKQLSRSSITTSNITSSGYSSEELAKSQYTGSQVGVPPNSYNQPPRPTREGSIGSSQPPRRGSQSSIGSSDVTNTGPSVAGQSFTATGPSSSINPNAPSTDIGSDIVGQTNQQIKGLFRKPSVSNDETGLKRSEDSEDTMKNLRKTFAGIFGDV
ncbi:synapsin [Brevipalpus obovatus]|uniref:synapsin n=1 Tax=Brevipalpus obovatus TaxID=246614 RepID=UPI003D9DF285